MPDFAYLFTNQVSLLLLIECHSDYSPLIRDIRYGYCQVQGKRFFLCIIWKKNRAQKNTPQKLFTSYNNVYTLQVITCLAFFVWIAIEKKNIDECLGWVFHVFKWFELVDSFPLFHVLIGLWIVFCANVCNWFN